MITCKICGVQFNFSEGEQEFYTSRSLAPPKRCFNCRAKQRKESKEMADLKARIKDLEKKNESILQSS